MFRKIWKTIKFFIILAVILIVLPKSILPSQTSDKSDDEIKKYIILNDKEERLKEYKDNEEALKLKLIQLEIINKSRKKYGAAPVKLDILASRVANKMCKEAAENNFIGHWNTSGEKPYHRYAFAGGYDHITENAYGEWSSDYYDSSPSNIAALMKSGHGKFMAEKSPNDGHKQTVIDKSHNFVGIGFYIAGKQFRYYEEFIDRYFEYRDIPDEVKTDEPFSITLENKNENFLYYLIVFREEFPIPLTPEQIRKKGSYDDFANEQYLKMTAWELASYRSGTTYKIPLSFSKEGLYYVHIYYDKNEIKNPASINTKGKTPASGIVIRVTK
jgi:uncharacterized protein YkwD